MSRSNLIFALLGFLVVAPQHNLRVVIAEGKGSLLVESDPVGAAVYVDGRLLGKTPLTLQSIPPGVHSVRLVRLGYLENSQLVTLKAGAREIVRARLTDPASQSHAMAALKI